MKHLLFAQANLKEEVLRAPRVRQFLEEGWRIMHCRAWHGAGKWIVILHHPDDSGPIPPTPLKKPGD